MREPEKYTMKEISVATGFSKEMLHRRRRRLGIPCQKGGYTMEEVKAMLKRPPNRHVYSARKAQALREMLKNDGAIKP